MTSLRSELEVNALKMASRRLLRLGLGISSSGGSLCRYSSAAAASLREVLDKELEAIRVAGTWKVERIITSPQAATIQVQERKGDILNFCANNYLGLSVSPHTLY